MRARVMAVLLTGLPLSAGLAQVRPTTASTVSKGEISPMRVDTVTVTRVDTVRLFRSDTIRVIGPTVTRFDTVTIAPAMDLEFKTGIVDLAASQPGSFRVLRDAQELGTTRLRYTQRYKSKRNYRVVDDRGAVICETDIEIRKEYQEVCLVCDIQRRRFFGAECK